MRRLVMLYLVLVVAGCHHPDPESGTESAGSVGAPVTTGEMGAASATAAFDTTTGATTTGADTTGAGTTAAVTTDAAATTSGGTGSTGAATTGDGGVSASTTEGDGADSDEDVWKPKGCPEIYAQNIVPTFALVVTKQVLAGLKQEWAAADDNDLTEFPLQSFSDGDVTITNASIRLRGNADHWPTQGKMQFEVEFDTFDPDGRYKGLRNVLFDAAEYNRSFLRDRLALSILRDAGVPAPCANNARVMLNGQYYGLFTSIEKVDREFLERHFEDASGNLYKRGGGGSLGWTKKTHEQDGDLSDIKELEAAKSVADLLAVLNLEQALLEWAGEAVIPDRDGLWAGGLNGYTYHDPTTGLFFMIPWDLDDSFTRLTPDVDPIKFKKPPDVFHGRKQYDIALKDPAWAKKYVAAVAHVVEYAYHADVLQYRIDSWAAQIADAVAADPNRPFTVKEHQEQVKEMREFVADRAAFLKGWLK